MGRSVWTPNNALEVVFFPVNQDEDCDYDWQELVEDIRETLKAEFSGFRDADHWPERESRCILEDDLLKIQISEYCGLVSLGVVINPHSALRDEVVEKHEDSVAKFVRETWGQLRKIGTFSNGESFFEQVSA